MRSLPFALLAALASIEMPHAAEVQCLPLDAHVTLSGFIVEGRFPGPPNYESIANGDADLVASFLQIPDALCLSDYEVPTTLIQLACADADLPEGEVVSVRGSLFSAHTGYHRSPVLLACD